MKPTRQKNKESVVAIRRATEDDLFAIHEVLRKGFNTLHSRGYSTKAIETAILTPSLIRRRLLTPEIRIFVATEKNQIIGTATGTKQWGHLHIQSLAVDPKYQRRRVGSRLILELEKHAHQTDCNKLFAQTAWVMFESIKLYWRLGFELEGYHPGHFWGEDLLSFGKIL